MRNKLFKRIYNQSLNMAWLAAVLFLPVTSMPLVASLIKTNTVATPSTLFIAYMAAAWLLPFVLKRRRMPGVIWPFLGFVMVVLILSARAFFLDVPSFKGQTIAPEMVSALVTLGVGAAFFLVTATWLVDDSRMRWTLVLINIGGAITILWSAVQGYYIFFHKSVYPQFMVDIQSFISLRRLFYSRATGFTFEPSWLAHQMNMLYLPYWMAASVLGFSAHRRRIWKISLENILLVGGTACLFISFSRVGWITFFAMVMFLVIRRVIRGIRWVQSWVQSKVGQTGWREKLLRWGIAAGLTLLFLGLIIGGGVLFIQFAGEYDGRLAQIFNRLAGATDFFDIANKLVIAERVIYWQVGWEVFNEFPLFGVGLGNAGFFLPEKMAYQGYGLVEISNILYRRTFIPNTKSMWIRLLAESGILGFSFFGAWLYTLGQAARVAQNSLNRQRKTVALMGFLTIVGYLLEGFSVDSFALPYFWLTMGMVTAVVHLYILEAKENQLD